MYDMTELGSLASKKAFVGFLIVPTILSLFYLSYYNDNFHHVMGIIASDQQQDQKKN
jgi:hypothetical protein